ncbi:Chloride channel CLIC-like protein 1 [Aphelenchoides bicaudatus]|nr:Chloride channel CLIC-like protein 1 [Aphelenchoides bicaudatus]
MKRLLFILLILASTKAENTDIDLDIDKTGWVNLLDPLSSELHGVGSAQQCENNELISKYQQRIRQLIAENDALKTKKSESVDVLLKHILRQFFIQLDVNLIEHSDVNKFARVYLSKSNVNTLLEYLNSQRHSEEIALREKLRFALENFIIAEEQADESGFLLALRRLVPFIIILNVIFLPLSIMSVLRKLVGPRQFIGFFLVATFCLSYYFTYIRKYQEVLADRFLRVHSPNDACSPKGLISEAFGVLLTYVRIKGKDQCLQKYEDMLVEPFLLVDPLQVFGEVVTNFLMSPFSVVGIHMNKFFNDFFVDTPIYLTAVKLVFIVFVLFYLSGYRFRSLFFTIEPTAPVRFFSADYYDTRFDRAISHEQTRRDQIERSETDGHGEARLNRREEHLHQMPNNLRRRRTLSVGAIHSS